MNAPCRRLTRSQEKQLLKAAAAAASSEFDMPIRSGCPEGEALKSLARRRPSVPESADLIDHIGTCSPCFIEYSKHRANYKNRGRIFSALALAAIVLFCFTVVRSLRTPIDSRPRTEIAYSQELTLDLRSNGVSRSDTPDSRGHAPTLRLPRTRIYLSIQLPVGSEDGIYDVAFVSLVGQTLLQTRGEAKLKNFVEVLPVQLNLVDLGPGLYQLRLRRAKERWSSYSVFLD
jgi:hypothetical protein